MITTIPLGDLVQKDAPICYGILMPGDHTEGGVPVVKVRDYDHRGIDVAQLLRASPEIEAPYRRSRLNPGDILISIRGTTGVVAIVPPELVGANITQDTARLRVASNNRDFVYHALHSPSVRRQIRLHTIGQAVKGINISAVRQLQIPWPEEGVRESFANVLCAVDRLSRSVASLIDLRREYKRGLKQQLLTGQKRFPQFQASTWNAVHLGDVFRERNEVNRSDLPLLSVTGDRGLIPRDEVEKRDTSNPDKGKYKRVAIGDIAYNTMRMWQGVSALASLEGIISPAYTVAIPTNKISGRFAKHLFKYPPVVNLFHRYSQGLVDDTLNLKFDRFAKIKLTIPNAVDEQERIADLIDLVDSEIELLSALEKQFESYKRGLLSRLLSGELQVPA